MTCEKQMVTLAAQVFGGFVDVKESQTSDGNWEATACKPVWDAGAAVPLSLKKKKTAAPAPSKVRGVRCLRRLRLTVGGMRSARCEVSYALSTKRV